MNRRTLLIGGAVGIIACLCLAVVLLATGALGVLGMTQPAADTGDKFMQALKAANYEGANALMTPELQKKVGNAQGLRKMIEGGKAQPTQWTFTERSINGNQGNLAGSVTMLSGDGTVSLGLVKSGDVWKIDAFDLKHK